MLNNIKGQKGFTIVELLIVIVVIGILAALVLNTFQGVQARARDTERRTDINSIATQLETYYTDFGYYPDGTAATACDDGASSTAACTLSTLLVGRGLDADALSSPDGTSINVTATAPTPANGQYYYEVLTADCTSNRCTSFTLHADLETETTDYTKDSLN